MTPHPKVAAGGIAGAVTALIVYILSGVGVDVPPEIASAITVIVGFAAAYLMPGVQQT